MLAVWTPTRFDVWLAIILTLAVVLAIKACRVRFPDPGIMQGYAAIANTKGGIILILLFLWIFTLVATLVFGIWVIFRNTDPAHAVVIQLLAMLTSGAFGGVSGALFKTMTGEDPKPPTITSTATVSTTEPAAATEPKEGSR